MRIALTIILNVIAVWLIYYFGLPTFLFGGWGWTVLVVGLVTLLVNIDYSGDDDSTVKPLGWAGIALMVFAAIIIPLMCMFSSWALFGSHDTAYHDLLGEVEVREVTSDIEPIDPKNIVIIDDETAHRLADKQLSNASDKTLGSQCVIGTLDFQKVGDKMYYVAPLLHTSYFKWSDNKEGTPGYIMVNATDDQDVHLVQQVAGKDIHIKYQPNACFGDNLERHIYMNGYSGTGVTEYSFEIDDTGKPYYIATLYDNTVGWFGENATGILTVDVETGEITKYTIDEAPAWIDRIQPKQFIVDQVNDWGEFVNGWYNPSDKDRVQLGSEISIVYGADGQCYYYCGITSVGSDNSSLGFLLVNSRTKHVLYYKKGGATEEAAMASAEGKVQQMGYRATHPRPYNIDGEWTYVMALKDNEGLIKSVAMVSVTNYDIVGVGETINDALRNYEAALSKTGNALVLEGQDNYVQTKGVVSRYTQVIREGNSCNYFMLSTVPDKVFIVSLSTSEESAVTRDGDSVSIAYVYNERAFINAATFDNLKINLKESAVQTEQDARFETTRDSVRATEDAHDANAKWDQITPAEKARLLQLMKSDSAGK